MDAERLRREVRAFDPNVPIERAWTPPSSWYVDPAFHELDARSVLARSWQPACRVDQLAGVGSYVAGCFAGEPWVVVRGEDLAIRGFYNVCRHKGQEVVSGEGGSDRPRADRLVCGYHGWSYRLDGRLARAPGIGGIEDFDRAAMSLAPLRVEVWGPWVFVSRARDAAGPNTRLESLARRLDAGDWRAVRFVDRQEWTLRCNWKVYVDNYLDGGYHVPHMHPALAAQLDMTSYRTELHDSFSIQSSEAAPAPGVRIGGGAIYAWIHPNFMINRYGPCLDSNHVIPLGPDRCRVVYEFFFDEQRVSDHAFIRDSIAQSDRVQREDIAVCESVQVGLGSSAYDRGRYAPRFETGAHQFHRLLAAEYRAALSMDSSRDGET